MIAEEIINWIIPKFVRKILIYLKPLQVVDYSCIIWYKILYVIYTNIKNLSQKYYSNFEKIYLCKNKIKCMLVGFIPCRK